MKLDKIKIENLLIDEIRYKILVSDDHLYSFYNDNIYFINSPYEIHFSSILKAYDLLLNRQKSISLEKNEFFCTEAFEILKKELSILPLWSSLMLNYFQTKFPLNYFSDSFTFLTNKPVLSYFNILKKHILAKEKKFNLTFFVGKLYSELKRIYLKYYEKRIENDENLIEMNEITKNSNRKSIKFVDQKEKWKGKGFKSRKRNFFSYYGTHLKENDFSIKEIYSFDYGYLNSFPRNYFEKIFNQNTLIISKNETSLEHEIFLRAIKKFYRLKRLSQKNYNYLQKRKKLLKNVPFLKLDQKKLDKKLHSHHFIFDEVRLKIIFNQVSDEKCFNIISKIFTEHRFILNESVNYIRGLTQLSYTNIHSIYEEYEGAFKNQSFRLIPVNSNADGNCLYNTFSLLFFNNQKYYFIFKLLSIYLLHEYYEKLQNDFPNKEIIPFIIQSLKTDEWGRDFNILSLAILFNTAIHVFKLGFNKKIEYLNQYLNNLISKKYPITFAYVFLNNNPAMGHFFPVFSEIMEMKSYVSFSSKYLTNGYPDKFYKFEIKEMCERKID